MNEPTSEGVPEKGAAQRAQAHATAVVTNLDWTLDRASKGVQDLSRVDGQDVFQTRMALERLLEVVRQERDRFVETTQPSSGQGIGLA